MQKQSNKTFKNVGAAWINKDKYGKQYLSIKVDKDIKAGEGVQFFQNKYKESAHHPDFVYLIDVEPEEEDKRGSDTSEDVANDVPF